MLLSIYESKRKKKDYYTVCPKEIQKLTNELKSNLRVKRKGKRVLYSVSPKNPTKELKSNLRVKRKEKWVLYSVFQKIQLTS